MKLRMATQIEWFIFVFVLAVPLRVKSKYCPKFCDCLFNSHTSDNSATCNIDDMSLYMNWVNSNYDPQLVVRCEGFENFNNCTELPHFNIIPNSLRISYCPSSLLSCLGSIKTYPRPADTIQLLEVINLIGNYTYEDFEGFEKVKIVVLNLTDENTYIPIESINALSNVKEVYVNGGNFRLDRNVFNYSLNIDKLYFRYNNMSALDVKSFKGLTCGTLYIESSNFENIESGTFKDITHLNELYIIKNKLKHIESDAFSSSTLSYLLLQSNMLEFLPNGLWKNIPQLLELKVINNEVDITLDTHVFSDILSSMNTIEIFGSKLLNLTDTLFSRSIHLLTLKLQETKIEVLPHKIFWDLIALNTLNLAGNNIMYIPDDLFAKLKNLKSLDLSDNQLTALKDNQFSSTPNLVTLSLNFNNFTQIHANTFSGTNLKRLSIVGNGLKTISGDTTNVWKKITYLNLYNNKLTAFEDLIYGLTNLIVANFSKNEIFIIRENKTYFLNNVILDLRQNKISSVIRDTNSENLISRKNILLYLTKNQLNCDCVVTTALHEWNKSGYLSDFKYINCSDKESVENLEPSIICNRTNAIIAMFGYSMVGALIMLIIILTIIGNRQKIWNFIIDVIQRYQSDKPEYSLSIEMDKNVKKTYDVFISYAHEDKDFVHKELVPILEEEFRLKVFIENKELVLKDDIEVSITSDIKEVIEFTDYFIIILTKDYIDSHILHLEFKIAHDLSIEEGLPKIILILLDESVTKNERITSDLKLYISVNTYLLWEDPRFREKLKKVLPTQQK